MTDTPICECMLDKLFLNGFLGRDPIAVQQRLTTGLWLRELYHERAALSKRLIGRYGHEIDHLDSELVEEARAEYRKAIRLVGHRANVLLGVCCHDSNVRVADIPDLLAALDIVASEM